MQADPHDARTMVAGIRAPRARRPWLSLISAVLNLAGARAELLRHVERPWSSVTFSGTRHMFTLVFQGCAAESAGEAFITALPEHEFAIPRQIVADAAVIAVSHHLLPEPRIEIEIELLLVEDL